VPPAAPAAPVPVAAPEPISGLAARTTRSAAGSDEHDLIRRIVAERDVTVEFEAVHDTVREQVVGYEALARGPLGPLRQPVHLFAAAHAAGLAGQLDWVCRAEAFRLMLERGLPPAVSLFVNVEPDSLIEPCPDDLLGAVWDATARLRVFIDITGRALSRYPFEVLETVRRARAAGWGVAVGDIEFSASGLALLPTLEPDVVKINHKVLTMGHGYAAATVTAVLGEVEHTGAALLVERIEDEAARRTSRSVGATFLGGRLFGSPAPLPASLPAPLVPLPLRPTRAPATQTPWHLLVGHGARVISAVPTAEADNLVRLFALQASGGAQPPVVALALPEGGKLTEQTRVSYRMLLERCPLVLVVGQDVGGYRDWRARAAELPDGHPLLRESCFVALSPTESMVLVTRDNPAVRGTVDLVTSQHPTVGREVMRYLADTMDTLAGGVRYGRLG
jgi:EAL domain-containing protein (putative c-di-GMP-specific phosphodiesterase class I)